jgi:hypothetical protein
MIWIGYEPMRIIAWIMSLAGLVFVLQACSSPSLSVTVVNETATTVDSLTLHSDGETKELTALEPNEPQTAVILVPAETAIVVELAGRKKAIDIYITQNPYKTLDLRIEEGDVVHWTYTEDDIFSAPVTHSGTARDL